MDASKDRNDTEPQRYRVFYCFYAEDAELPADNALDLDLEEIYSELLGRLTSDGDYLGMVDGQGHTLQIMYQATDDHYWVEIPCPERQGSYGCEMDFDHIVDLMKSLPTRFVPQAIPDLAFTAW